MRASPAVDAPGAQVGPSPGMLPGTTRSDRFTPTWPGVVLLALCAIVIGVGVLTLGPPSGPATRDRIVTAERGVVQSTVSGSGTLQPVTTMNVNFRTGGQLAHVYVRQGQNVHTGQLLADVASASATASLELANANLASANAKLAQLTSGTSSAATSGSQQTTAPSSSQGTRSGQSSSGQTAAGSTGASQAPTAADIAAAEAAVVSAKVSVESAQRNLDETKLYAPVSGTVTALNGVVGDVVGSGSGSSAGGAGGSSGSSSSSAAGGSSAGGSTAGAAAGGAAASGGSSSSGNGTSAGSSAFIVITELDQLRLKVPLSESDIHRVQVGQPASVTVNALPSEKLAAHVTAIDDLSTTSNGVVSYNVTLAFDQTVAGLKPGMTASAQVIASQIDGVITVPTSAVSRRGLSSLVTVVQAGKKTQQPVVTGIVGDSTIQVVSGLNAGQQVAISIPTGSSGATGAASAGGGGGLRGLGGGGVGGGGLGGGGGFRGGGPPGGG